MDVDQLRGELRVAGTDIGVDLSAGKARQLACSAQILPAVPNGAAVPLDLGRANRIFSDAQRTMLAAPYESCATVGCDRPYAWSELHHQQHWEHGGTTDLDRAIPLYWRHHRTSTTPIMRMSGCSSYADQPLSTTLTTAFNSHPDQPQDLFV